MKRFAAAALAALMAAGLSGCGWQTVDPDEARESIQVIAMDTVMIFTTYGEKSTHADYLSEDEVRRLESLLSRTDSESGLPGPGDRGPCRLRRQDRRGDRYRRRRWNSGAGSEQQTAGRQRGD